MGIWFSSPRRHRRHPPPPPPPPHHHYYYYHATEPTSLPPPPPPLPPPPHNYLIPAPCPIPNPSYYHHPAYYAPVNYSVNPLIGARGYGYGWGQQGWVGGVGGVGVGGGGDGVVVVVPNVERESAVKVKSDVNVRKETVRVEVDEENPDCHLVSFDFDASFDGSITIYYFSKKEDDFTFTPIFPEAHVPVKIPFQKGSGQKFKQPSGTGIDLGFFELEDLAKPSPEGDVYPLVIAAEVCSTSSSSKEENSSSTQSDGSPRFQITQTVLEKKNGEPFQVKVMTQILVIEGVSYELRELYGMGSSTSEDFNEDPGKECVICMTEPKDTAVLPCRHLCMCGECAQALRLQSNKCPICRQPIEKLMEIKVNTTRYRS
ncbi:putative E3 ubiquitin-protein ligase LUL4 [Drosera capensis]